MYTTTNPVLEPSLQCNIAVWISIEMGSSFPYKAAYSIFGELHKKVSQYTELEFGISMHVLILSSEVIQASLKSLLLVRIA